MDKLVGIDKWRALDGDNTLALAWDLNEDSHVWEIGGYEGRWAEQIWKKFHCHITIFEPQNWAVHKLLKRFIGIEKVTVLPYGLWVQDDILSMGNYETDGASVINNSVGTVQKIGVKDIIREVQRFRRYASIDLALMNVEGAEFDLIPALITSGEIRSFNYFWAQFHPGLVEDGDNRAFRMFKTMDATHEVMWECYPTAVAWKRR